MFTFAVAFDIPPAQLIFFSPGVLCSRCGFEVVPGSESSLQDPPDAAVCSCLVELSAVQRGGKKMSS